MGLDGPQTVAEGIITTLRSREENGLVDLTPKARFNHGAAVKTTEGPFAGLSLIYEGMSAHDRVKVLVDLLGRAVVVEVEEKLLVAA